MSEYFIAALDSTRKKILFFLIAFAVVDALVATFAYSNDGQGNTAKRVTTDVEVTVTAGIAALMAIVVVVRQGLDGLHGKTYTALAIGATMWFAGEILFLYYEVGTNTILPQYSLADIFWMFGYGFFGYHLFKTYLYFAKSVNLKMILFVAYFAGLGISFVIYNMFHVSNFMTSEDIMTFLFKTSYPVGDLVLMVPSIALLITLRKAKLHFSPWFFISIGLLVTAAADSLFSYISLVTQGEDEWIANLLYDSANLCIAGGLYWYNRFVLLDPVKGINKITKK